MGESSILHSGSGRAENSQDSLKNLPRSRPTRIAGATKRKLREGRPANRVCPEGRDNWRIKASDGKVEKRLTGKERRGTLAEMMGCGVVCIANPRKGDGGVVKVTLFQANSNRNDPVRRPNEAFCRREPGQNRRWQNENYRCSP